MSKVIGLMGESGSGKTTLMKLLLKELEPTSGTIIVNGKNYAMYYGYSAALYSMLLKKCGLTFVLACIMVAISLVIMVTGIFMKPVIYNAMQFVYLGFSTLMTALWFIFDSDFYQYIFNNYYIPLNNINK